jgi:hypothetical protein
VTLENCLLFEEGAHFTEILFVHPRGIRNFQEECFVPATTRTSKVVRSSLRVVLRPVVSGASPPRLYPSQVLHTIDLRPRLSCFIHLGAQSLKARHLQDVEPVPKDAIHSQPCDMGDAGFGENVLPLVLAELDRKLFQGAEWLQLVRNPSAFWRVEFEDPGGVEDVLQNGQLPGWETCIKRNTPRLRKRERDYIQIDLENLSIKDYLMIVKARSEALCYGKSSPLSFTRHSRKREIWRGIHAGRFNKMKQDTISTAQIIRQASPANPETHSSSKSFPESSNQHTSVLFTSIGDQVRLRDQATCKTFEIGRENPVTLSLLSHRSPRGATLRDAWVHDPAQTRGWSSRVLASGLPL